MYDKGVQFNSRSREKKLPVNQFTRVEVRLWKAKLRKAFGGKPVRELRMEQLIEAFYREMYRFDEKVSLPGISGDGSVAQLVALLMSIPLENRLVNGVDPLEIWLACKQPQPRNRLLRKAREIVLSGKPRFLRDLLPDDPACLFTQLEDLLPANLRRAS